VRRTALVLAALALTETGCETTAEKSAKLEQAARRRPKPSTTAQKGLSISHQSTAVRVVGASIVHSSEGSAVAVTLRNRSAKALREVPIEITVKDRSGATVYTNSTPGLSHTLVTVALLAAHAQLTWVDDQVQASGTPSSVTVKVGEAPTATGTIPAIAVAGAHLFEDPTSGDGARGAVVNRSRVAQQELAVYAIATRAGRIVAAGRAIVPQLAAGASEPFQVFFIGDPGGARLALSAPPSTLG
jgi:hypothetical protein